MEVKQPRINEITKDKREEVEVYCYQQRLLTHIRSVKLVRDIGNGKQQRLSKWGS